MKEKKIVSLWQAGTLPQFAPSPKPDRSLFFIFNRFSERRKRSVVARPKLLVVSEAKGPLCKKVLHL
jgi:hypothetical protein